MCYTLNYILPDPHSNVEALTSGNSKWTIFGDTVFTEVNMLIRGLRVGPNPI